MRWLWRLLFGPIVHFENGHMYIDGKCQCGNAAGRCPLEAYHDRHLDCY